MSILIPIVGGIMAIAAIVAMLLTLLLHHFGLPSASLYLVWAGISFFFTACGFAFLEAVLEDGEEE